MGVGPVNYFIETECGVQLIFVDRPAYQRDGFLYVCFILSYQFILRLFAFR